MVISGIIIYIFRCDMDCCLLQLKKFQLKHKIEIHKVEEIIKIFNIILQTNCWNNMYLYGGGLMNFS